MDIVLATQVWISSIHREAGAAAHTCNPSTGDAKTGESLERSGQLEWLDH